MSAAPAKPSIPSAALVDPDQFDQQQAAHEIGLLAQQIINLAPVAGLYVGITIEPARGEQ